MKRALMAVAVLVVVVVGATAIGTKSVVQPVDGFVAPVGLPVSESLPLDTFVFDSDRSGTFEVYLQGADGTVVALTDDDAWDTWWGRISPDRRTVLVQRSPAGSHDKDYGVVGVWAVAADGSSPTLLRPAGLDRWPRQGHPEWSPDGQSLTLFGGPDGRSPQIFVTNALGQQPRAVTDRPGSNLDPSFSPDGLDLVFVGCPSAICLPSSYEVYRVSLAGGEAIRLTADGFRDHDPYVSPDGLMVAWLTQTAGPGVHPLGSWNIRSAPFDVEQRSGPQVNRVTDDEHINSRPVFSLDGSWIYFHRLEYGLEELAFDVYRIRPDGTGMVSLTDGQPGVNEYPGT